MQYVDPVELLNTLARTPSKQPGTQVIRNADGVVIKRGTVTVTIDKSGETSEDSSGKAVLCYWTMMTAIKVAADLCYPEEFVELRRVLDEWIDEANSFIAANSLRPVTKAELQKSVVDRHAKTAAALRSEGIPAAQNAFCKRRREADLLPLTADLATYRRELKEVLAAPRPPAMNPCI